MSEKVKGYIKKLFVEMNDEVADIVSTSLNSTAATQSIMEYVSSKIAASSEGYMVDLYGELSRKTLSEEIFKDSANANKFYELNMRKKISDAYKFDVQDLDAYSEGIDFKEINRLYTSAGVAVGGVFLGGILMGALSGVVHIPLVVIIAGAVVAGLAAGGVTYVKGVPNTNRVNFKKAVVTFMSELEEELLNWVDDVVEFYNQKVEELKATL